MNIIDSITTTIAKEFGLESKPKTPSKQIELSEDCFIINRVGQEPLILKNIFNGVMIVGQPGSGKTASAIHPLLYQVMQKDWPGLIYDLKGKLADEVMSAYESLPDKSNRKTSLKFINFADPSRSARINPIHPTNIKNKSEVLDFVSTLLSNLMATDGSKTEDPFWYNNARNILSAITWYLRNNHPNFCSIPHAIALTYWEDPEELLFKLQSYPESARMLATLNISSQANDKKLFINILSTLYTHLMGLDLPELFFVLTGNEVSLNLNSHETPTLLTIANHEPLQQVYSPIIAVICNVVTQRMNEDGKRKGIIMFDEFASIKIPNFERIPETIRSRGVATVIAVHDKPQLVTKYGDSIAETIASTLATKIYFKSTNSKTVEEAVKIFGKRDVKFKTISKPQASVITKLLSKNVSLPSVSETIQQRDYLPIDELTNYDRGVFAGIYSEANIKYSKGSIAKIEKLPIRGKVLPRIQASEKDIQENYKRVYSDIASIFNKKDQGAGSAADLKIDFN